MVPAEPGLLPSLPISSAHSQPLHTTHYPERPLQMSPGSGVWLLAPGGHTQQAPHARQVVTIPSLTDTASRCPVKVYRCWQLWASQIRMSLLRSPEACGNEGNGHRHTPHTQTSHPPTGPTQSYEVLAIRGDGHAEDVAAVAGRLALSTLLGSRDHMQLPPRLYTPCHRERKEVTGMQGRAGCLATSPPPV